MSESLQNWMSYGTSKMASFSDVIWRIVPVTVCSLVQTEQQEDKLLKLKLDQKEPWNLKVSIELCLVLLKQHLNLSMEK